MAGLRGPDSSKDAQLLDERAVFPETVDVNIRQLDPIPAPRYFLKELPLTNEMSDLVLKSRQEIRDVLMPSAPMSDGKTRLFKNSARRSTSLQPNARLSCVTISL